MRDVFIVHVAKVSPAPSVVTRRLQILNADVLLLHCGRRWFIDVQLLITSLVTGAAPMPVTASPGVGPRLLLCGTIRTDIQDEIV